METWKAIIIGSLIIALAIIFSKTSDNHIKVTTVADEYGEGVVYYHDTKTKKTCYEPLDYLTGDVLDDLLNRKLLVMKMCENPDYNPFERYTTDSYKEQFYKQKKLREENKQ